MTRQQTALLAVAWLVLALYVLLRVALDAGLGVLDVVFVAWLGGVVSVSAWRRLVEWWHGRR